MIDVKFDMFFDRPAVISAIQKGKRDSLSRAGSFGRQVMKRLFRRRKKSSTAGNPPSSHVGLLRDLTYFGYDAASDSVVIGPQLIGRGAGSPTTPEVLNDGGQRDGKTYHSFPFVAPTLEAVNEKFESMFAGSVR